MRLDRYMDMTNNVFGVHCSEAGICFPEKKMYGTCADIAYHGLYR